MGNTYSFCPMPLQALLVRTGIGGQGVPDGIFVKDIEYSLTRLIGEGAYCLVYEGTNCVTGETCALKRYIFQDESQRHRASEEIQIYEALPPHENIVTLLAADVLFRPRSNFPEMYLVLQHCSGPSLQAYINNRISMAQAFSVLEVYEIVDQIIHAIAHLHSQTPPISHWDIKPDNLLFTGVGTLKLCDFGSATRTFIQANSTDEIQTMELELESRMTTFFRPPESLDLWSKKRVDMKADVWALGVIIYTLVFRERPFDGSAVEIIDGIPKRLRGVDDLDSVTPSEFQPLMRIVCDRIFVSDPAQRGDIFAVSAALSKVNNLDPVRDPGGQPQEQLAFRV